MPNLARSSLRALEAVRSSCSLESDLQVPGSRIPRTQQRSAGQCHPSTPPSPSLFTQSTFRGAVCPLGRVVHFL